MNQLAKVAQTKNEVAQAAPRATVSKEVMSTIVLTGNLKDLNPEEKMQYYYAFCANLGLDPTTKPFQLIEMKGKQSLYCDRSGTAQLNKKYNINHNCLEVKEILGCYLVIMKADDGKHYTESTGAVWIKGLSGEELANALMKAETKAKRRSTLDLVGLGILDESEIGSIKGAKKIDIQTGEIIDEVVDQADDKKPASKTTTQDKPANEPAPELTAEDYHAYKAAIEAAPSLDDLKSVFKEAWRTFEGDTDAQDDFKTVYENRKAVVTAVAAGAPANQKPTPTKTTSSLRELRNQKAA